MSAAVAILREQLEGMKKEQARDMQTMCDLRNQQSALARAIYERGADMNEIEGIVTRLTEEAKQISR